MTTWGWTFNPVMSPCISGIVLDLWHICNSQISFCEEVSNGQVFHRTILEHESHELTKLSPSFSFLFLPFNMVLEIEHRASHTPRELRVAKLHPNLHLSWIIFSVFENQGFVCMIVFVPPPTLERVVIFFFATPAPWQYRQMSACRNYDCIVQAPPTGEVTGDQLFFELTFRLWGCGCSWVQEAQLPGTWKGSGLLSSTVSSKYINNSY